MTTVAPRRLTALLAALAFAFTLAAAPPPAAAIELGQVKGQLSQGAVKPQGDALVPLSPSTLADLKAMGVPFGAPKGGHETGFDIYRDTPSFGNWGGKTFINKGGTCLGMDVIIKHFYEKVDFREGPVSTREQIARALLGRNLVISGYADFRDMSKKQEDLLKSYMVAGHLDNFHPENIVKGIGNLFGAEFPGAQRALIHENLRLGKPAIIGIYNSKSPQVFGKNVPVVRKLENGHAIMAYKSADFETKTLFFIYDPNVVYEPKAQNHRKYALVFDKVTKRWELYPQSYKAWYADWYPDHLLVVSGNHMDDMLRSEVTKALEAAADATRRGIDALADVGRKAVDSGRAVVDAGAKRASEIWNGITGGAKKLWKTLF